jgi:hypothetical protein
MPTASRRTRISDPFQAIVPQQMVRRPGAGDAGANAYALAVDMKPEEFVARGNSLLAERPRQHRRADARWTTRNMPRASPFGLKSDTGVTMLERATA